MPVVYIIRLFKWKGIRAFYNDFMLVGLRVINISFSVLVPGPNITQINATSSTSINVTWGEVPSEDINGIITHYFVCNKPQTSSNDICSVRKKVDGVNNTRTVLNDLNEFTTYSVAIQAATSERNGTHGAIKNVMTLEDSKY